jgi:hypothetical protein
MLRPLLLTKMAQLADVKAMPQLLVLSSHSSPQHASSKLPGRLH